MERIKELEELIRGRRSVRTYDSREIDPADLETLSEFLGKVKNPYEIPVSFRLLDAAEHSLSSPVISGAGQYLAGKVAKIPHAEEAFGYSFELMVLCARALGLGTVWIGGTMNRAAFEYAAEVEESEIMPCVTALGYPAQKMSLRETMMRKAVKADDRLPFESLFFEGDFSAPLTPEAAGELALPLEMVRWAPSAGNRQPWRLVLSGNEVHFYLKRNKGFSGEATGDLQKVDLGIALCHFAFAASECGISIRFATEDPGLPHGADTEYIATYVLEQTEQPGETEEPFTENP